MALCDTSRRQWLLYATIMIVSILAWWLSVRRPRYSPDDLLASNWCRVQSVSGSGGDSDNTYAPGTGHGASELVRVLLECGSSGPWWLLRTRKTGPSAIVALFASEDDAKDVRDPVLMIEFWEHEGHIKVTDYRTNDVSWCTSTRKTCDRINVLIRSL